MKKLFYRVKSVQTDKSPEKIIQSFQSVAFPSKHNLFSENQFYFRTGVTHGGNRLYITFHVRGKVVPDFSSNRNLVTFSVQPPPCSYIGLMIFTAAVIYSCISLLLSAGTVFFFFAACIFEILYIANIKWQMTACEEKIIHRLRN